MKVIYNDFIPFKGYYAIMLFGILFVRSEYKNTSIKDYQLNHENIHLQQMKDFWIFGYLLFYLLYFIEWLLKIPFYFFGYSSYRSISFEQEAFKNQWDLDYLHNRKRFVWIKYIFKLVKR